MATDLSRSLRRGSDDGVVDGRPEPEVGAGRPRARGRDQAVEAEQGRAMGASQPVSPADTMADPESHWLRGIER